MLSIGMFAWDGGGIECGLILSESSYVPFCTVVDNNSKYQQTVNNRRTIAYKDNLWLEIRVFSVLNEYKVDIYVEDVLVGEVVLHSSMIKNVGSTNSYVSSWDGNFVMTGVYKYFEDANVAISKPRIKYLSDVNKVTEVTWRELWPTG